MPRPQPIIIPGPSGFGSNFQHDVSEVNLTGLIRLLDATLGERAREKKRISAGEAAARLLQPAKEAKQQRVITGPEGFGTNFPDQPATEAGEGLLPIAQSERGRQTIFDMLKSSEGGGESETFPTPRMYQNESGEYRWGFYSKEAEPRMVKDIRKATKKELEGAAAVNVNIMKGLPAETAGKLAMLRQANKEVQQVEDMIFDKKGNVKLLSQVTGFLNIPHSQGRKINSRIENAIAAKLRIETGATATPDEIKNIAKRFKPVPGIDNAESTRDKLNRLKEFLGEAAFYVDPTGKYVPPQPKKTEASQGQGGKELTYDPTTGELR